MLPRLPVRSVLRPYLKDSEAYRAQTRKQIKEWHASVTQRKNQEWLILHVVRPDSKTQSGAFFVLKGSVLDKVRADFNTDKRERSEFYCQVLT